MDHQTVIGTSNEYSSTSTEHRTIDVRCVPHGCPHRKPYLTVENRKNVCHKNRNGPSSSNTKLHVHDDNPKPYPSTTTINRKFYAFVASLLHLSQIVNISFFSHNFSTSWIESTFHPISQHLPSPIPTTNHDAPHQPLPSTSYYYQRSTSSYQGSRITKEQLETTKTNQDYPASTTTKEKTTPSHSQTMHYYS